MAKFELTKSVEGVKVSKRSGIPTTERVTVSFGAIIEDPREERDCLRFLHLGELIDVKYSEVQGYYKPIDGATPEPASKSTPAPAAKSTPAPAAKPEPPADPRFIRWESIPSNFLVQRAKVPGGWLVATAHGNGLAFVPDVAHDWDGSSL